jgi:hypothetical protein
MIERNGSHCEGRCGNMGFISSQIKTVVYRKTTPYKVWCNGKLNTFKLKMQTKNH